ncbi:MAG: hypothetical protein ABW073_00845 [Acidimicrobiia bacterium]
MGREQLTQVVDQALERFRGRDLVTSVEVTDVLLDLRLLLLDSEALSDDTIVDEALHELLEEPAPTAG